jgi:hypothetical protein
MMSRFLAFKRPVQPAPPEESDSLLSFEAEADRTSGSIPINAPATRRPTIAPQALLAGLLFLSIFALGAISAIYLRYTPVAAPASARTHAVGTATIASEPPGAEVLVNGVLRGTTPLELQLEAGSHAVELRNGGATRNLALSIAAGERSTQYVELAAPAAAPLVGRLEVTSDPPGARVMVDSAFRGTTPVALADIAPGAHRVVVSNGTATLQRTVQMEAGATATVAVSLAAATGWISFAAPFEMHVFDRGELVGTTLAQRLLVPAGRRDIELVSQAFGFRYTANVDVPAGRSTTVQVPVPNGSLSINALPWAEVWIDGRNAGTTPLANLSVPVGNHEVVWRHPKLGERRQTVAVTAQAPARVGVDLAK